MQFLMGLDDTYMQLRINILSRDPLADAKGAYANNNGNRRTAGGPTLVCEHCGFNGHTIDRCFKLIAIKVSHPNRTYALITKVGNLILTKFLTLYDVLVVPEYSITLISVHTVARDNKFIVGFDESKCFLMSQDLMHVKIMGIGKQVNGLYYFNSMEAKQTREPFPLSEHKSTILGELVHLDLSGPYRVVSKEGHRLPSILKVPRFSASENRWFATSEPDTALSKVVLPYTSTTEHGLEKSFTCVDKEMNYWRTKDAKIGNWDRGGVVVTAAEGCEGGGSGGMWPESGDDAGFIERRGRSV
ncbi:hypothetical protein Tco_0988189 [Tanacetum coccineum]|uniref:Gag-pol polyprotein n=1 Tax=Tanacetum coccineum TaxID=301880 RepID=A0ABQ5EQF7_9ASTR